MLVYIRYCALYYCNNLLWKVLIVFDSFFDRKICIVSMFMLYYDWNFLFERLPCRMYNFSIICHVHISFTWKGLPGCKNNVHILVGSRVFPVCISAAEVEALITGVLYLKFKKPFKKRWDIFGWWFTCCSGWMIWSLLHAVALFFLPSQHFNLCKFWEKERKLLPEVASSLCHINFFLYTPCFSPPPPFPSPTHVVVQFRWCHGSF